VTNKTDEVAELMDNIDDIANKPWRAIRYIENFFAEHSKADNDYAQECIEEWKKLEAFYSNGGSKYIDDFLKNRTLNPNFPEYWERDGSPAGKEEHNA
jgi:hypothetical protein